LTDELKSCESKTSICLQQKNNLFYSDQGSENINSTQQEGISIMPKGFHISPKPTNYKENENLQTSEQDNTEIIIRNFMIAPERKISQNFLFGDKTQKPAK